MAKPPKPQTRESGHCHLSIGTLIFPEVSSELFSGDPGKCKRWSPWCTGRGPGPKDSTPHHWLAAEALNLDFSGIWVTEQQSRSHLQRQGNVVTKPQSHHQAPLPRGEGLRWQMQKRQTLPALRGGKAYPPQ